MTKQHFIAFADAIRHSNESLEVRTAMAKMFMEVASRFNGKFDRTRFYEACGLK